MKKKRKRNMRTTTFAKNMKWTKHISEKGAVTVKFERVKKEDADVLKRNPKYGNAEINERLKGRFMKKEE